MDELLNWLDSNTDSDSPNSALLDFNAIQDFVFDHPPLSPPPPHTIADKSSIAAVASNAPSACPLSNPPTGASGFMNTSCDSAAAGNLTGAKPDSGGKVACSIVPVEEMEKVRLGGGSAFEEGSDSKILCSEVERFTELREDDDGGEIRQASSAEGDDLGNLNEGPVSCNATVQSGSGDDSSYGSSDSESTDDSDDDDSGTDEEEDDDGDCDDDDKKAKQDEEDVDMEDGEIWGLEASREAVESDDEEIVSKGPIRSKHELEILPPVPSVNVTLEQHHQMTPVGTILSIVDTKVIVEGGEKHNPLNEGSILWITEFKLPLGYVDEIFGPVKNPVYVVRSNFDKEVPPDIHEGTLVSFVREFVSHVLIGKDLYKKGYDASGENDEEVTDEAEFSDDEKEAEFKRMQRTGKRGKDNANSKSGDYLSTKRVSGKGGSWKGSRFNSSKQEKLAVNPASGARQLLTPPTQMASESGSRSWVHDPRPMNCLNGPRQDMESIGVWPNAVSTQHPVLQSYNGILMGDMRFPQQAAYQFYGYPQTHQQYPTLAGFSAQLPFPQQFAPNQGGMPPLPQLNFPMGMTSPMWPAAQFPPNQVPLVTGLPGGGQLSSFPGNMLAAQQFNPGNASVRGGRKPFRQGRGGHFLGRQGLQ